MNNVAPTWLSMHTIRMSADLHNCLPNQDSAVVAAALLQVNVSNVANNLRKADRRQSICPPQSPAAEGVTGTPGQERFTRRAVEARTKKERFGF